MYGTIAHLHVKPGMAQRFMENMQRQEEEIGSSEIVASYVYQMDNNPDELMLAVIFKSKEAYVANAESPAQHQRFLDMMKSLSAEPEWHDGQVVWSYSQ